MSRARVHESATVSAAHVALLRGINVGGKNKLPMKVLAAFFEDAGCADVRTYIQSGNVVFEATAALAARVPALVSARIEAELGFAAPIVLRSAAQLEALLQGNPYLRADATTRVEGTNTISESPSQRRLDSNAQNLSRRATILGSSTTGDACHVAFLQAVPSAALVASLDAQRSPPDAFTVRGADVYLWLPNGVARTKLTNAYFDARLRTVSTVRNWRTVCELAAMTRAAR